MTNIRYRNLNSNEGFPYSGRNEDRCIQSGWWIQIRIWVLHKMNFKTTSSTFTMKWWEEIHGAKISLYIPQCWFISEWLKLINTLHIILSEITSQCGVAPAPKATFNGRQILILLTLNRNWPYLLFIMNTTRSCRFVVTIHTWYIK